MLCEQGIEESQIDNRFTHAPLQNPCEHITGPKEAMQKDLVADLPPSGGYQNIATVMELSSRYLFAYHTTNKDAKIVAKLINNTMAKHAYLTTTLIFDKISAFLSQVMEEKADVLVKTLAHATTKQAETTGMSERTYASLKKAIKVEFGE